MRYLDQNYWMLKEERKKMIIQMDSLLLIELLHRVKPEMKPEMKNKQKNAILDVFHSMETKQKGKARSYYLSSIVFALQRTNKRFNIS